jgi:glycosyltransferase involved in cell wall biosynthesis
MTQNSGPLVSILVPAFNAKATLADTLQSALASSHANLEVVLVDDGSTDGTAAIAESFARRDARLRLFRQRHRGVSGALNFGLTQIRGELVARLDADDLWHPTKLEKQVALLAADPALALAYTFIRYVDASGRIVRDAAPQNLAGRALCQCLYDGIVGGGSSVVFRRSLLERPTSYDERLSVWEDLLLHLRLAAAGTIASVPEYLTAYRLREMSSSADRTKSLKNWRIAYRIIESDFPQIPKFVHSWSNARRLLELAEGFALDRRYAISAMLFAECLAADPVRATAFLAYRLRRRLKGNRRPVRGSGPLFADAGVKTNYCLTPFDAGLEGDRLNALDERRRRLLRSIDSRLSPRPTGAEETTPLAVAAP